MSKKSKKLENSKQKFLNYSWIREVLQLIELSDNPIASNQFSSNQEDFFTDKNFPLDFISRLKSAKKRDLSSNFSSNLQNQGINLNSQFLPSKIPEKNSNSKGLSLESLKKIKTSPGENASQNQNSGNLGNLRNPENLIFSKKRKNSDFHSKIKKIVFRRSKEISENSSNNLLPKESPREMVEKNAHSCENFLNLEGNPKNHKRNKFQLISGDIGRNGNGNEGKNGMQNFRSCKGTKNSYHKSVNYLSVSLSH